MKKLITLFFLSAFCLTINAKDIKSLVVTTVPQMTCQNCENRIKSNIRFEKGVRNIATDLENQRITVTYDADKTTEENLIKAFGKLKYEAIRIGKDGKPEKEVKQSEGSCSDSSCSK